MTLYINISVVNFYKICCSKYRFSVCVRINPYQGLIIRYLIHIIKVNCFKSREVGIE